jgi:hypothetical protein
VRPAAASAVLGLALAVGAPTAWAMTRPEAAVGTPVEQALESPGTTEGAPPAAPSEVLPGAPGLSLPPGTVRDASPAAAPAVVPPVRLELPTLGVTAPVDPVGVADDGQMALPDDVGRVGWYRFGPAPGDPGNAVIAGHVDDREQGRGVLFDLRDVAPGDQFVVTDAEGQPTRWQVVSRELVHKQALPLDRIFARNGPARLVVVTCGGPFLPEFRSYRDNVVVVAEPVP